MTDASWVIGDLLKRPIPSHSEAFKAAGTEFLNKALRTTGSLPIDNYITNITRIEPCLGGSTGHKLRLDVNYANNQAGLHQKLFVKFSRDFNDKMRDQLKDQLEAEVKMGLLSKEPDFPIEVPKCYFADYHQSSGTGILITERIAFGLNGIEPIHEKCLDHLLPNALEYYRAIIKTLATLAGTQQSKSFNKTVERYFPRHNASPSLQQPIRYDEHKMQDRINKYCDFANRYPQLIPGNLRTPEFFAQLKKDIPLLLKYEKKIKTFLHTDNSLIALMHWNANIDNAWFSRNKDGELSCGLMDWGSTSQMNIGLALWGSLSAAETNIWNNHLDELIDLFVTTAQQSGGVVFFHNTLRLHIQICAIMMGLAWLMDAPALIKHQVSDLHKVPNRFDPRICDDEMTRTQLQMLSNFLNQLQRLDLSKLINQLANQ